MDTYKKVITAVLLARKTIDWKESRQETSQILKDNIHDRILYIFQKDNSFNINLFVQIKGDDLSISCSYIW